AGGPASHLIVTNSTFEQIGRIGIIVKGTGSTATITDNTYIGKGNGDFLDYAFEFGAGGSGTISGNTISGNRGVAAIDGSTSAGILVTEYYGSGTNATITSNTFFNNSAGLHVGYLDTDASVVVAHDNNFGGETVGLESDATKITVNASNNWWGSALETDVQSKISGLVNYIPWYINAGRTTLSDAFVGNIITASSGSFDLQETALGEAGLPTGATQLTLSDTSSLDLSNATTSMTSTPVVIGGNTVTLTQSVTLQSGVDTQPIVLINSNPNVLGVSASIPDGTKIQGPAEWDGKIVPPVSVAPSGNPPAGFTVGSTVISIGSPLGTLVFDQAVKIVLPGVTGTVGYKPVGSDWQTITTPCTSADVPGISSGECSIPDGGNTIIWTYHFTTFGSLSAIPAPVPASGGGGGGGGGIVGSYGQVNSQGGFFAPQIVVTTPSPVQPPAGQVLGIATYVFNRDLKIGARGTDVTELQKYLTANAIYSGPVTGYFGKLTKNAVKSYQKNNKLPSYGFFGPMTRALVNKTVK
ncbi:MAG: peptidoglycan-binding protein, partial [Patescibacteria group bacterium]